MNKAKLRLDSGQIEVMDSAMAEALKRKTPAERIKIGFDMWESARRMLMSHLKATNAGEDIRNIEEEAARRLSHGAV